MISWVSRYTQRSKGLFPATFPGKSGSYHVRDQLSLRYVVDRKLFARRRVNTTAALLTSISSRPHPSLKPILTNTPTTCSSSPLPLQLRQSIPSHKYNHAFLLPRLTIWLLLPLHLPKAKKRSPVIPPQLIALLYPAPASPRFTSPR
jgi:hypothetical protein